MKNRNQNGFTLYELMITVTIIGVILMIGIPNFSEFTRNSRMSGTANDLHSSFLLARSEAARSKSNITICASDDPAGAALCDGASFDDGWIVFIDTDGDIARAGAGENVLRAHPPVPELIDIIVDNGATYFSFAPTGLGRGDVNGPSFVGAIICDDRGKQVAAGGRSSARLLIVTPIGRATVISDEGVVAANPRNCP